MKPIRFFFKRALILLFPALWVLTGCEDVIDLTVANAPKQLVVDGWITNQPGVQSIRLSWSAPYFEYTHGAPILNATVTVTDDLGNVFEFTDANKDGRYEWGSDSVTLGHVGRSYTLSIQNGTDKFTAINEIKRVPTVDSLVYQKETLPFTPDNGPKEGYVAQFYARDFVGEGDTYWIKPVINGAVKTSDPTSISVAYDAAFGAGAPSDGMIFILPLRQSITTDSLYLAGVKIGVELHSITTEAYDFLSQVRDQTSNGGIFATPMTNVLTNVVNSNPNGPKALGYFGTSAVSRLETVIDPAKARPEK